MNDVTALLAAYRDVLFEHRYIILLAVTVFEGTWTVLLAGVLSATGFFVLPFALISCIIGETIGGMMWYAIGYFFGGRSIDWMVRNSPTKKALLASVRKHTERATGLIVFLVKVTYSITTPTLILVGMLKYDIRKYTIINFIGSVFWATMLIGLGYFLGDRAREYVPVLKTVGHAVVTGTLIVLAGLAVHRFGRIFLKRVERQVNP